MTVSIDEVEYALRDLGSTPEQVADALSAAGVSGFRSSAGSCPVAHYLQKQLDEPLVYVSHANVFVPGVLTDESTDVDVEPPSAVANFIGQFDSGLYPNLIDPDDDTL